METKQKTQECWYELMKNPQGELLIVMDAFDEEPEMPRLVYDGGDRMLFYRTPVTGFTLSGLDPESAGKYIMGVEEITVAELDEEDIVREYGVKVNKIKSLDSLLQ